MKLCVTAGESNLFANSTDASADLFDGEPQALFEFSVSPESAASYTYQGLYPASAALASNNTNPAAYKVNLPAAQNSTASSYDPAAYIMVAKPATFDQVESDWTVSFRRATALNKVTLKNIPEDVVSVEFIAPEGVYLAGRARFDLTEGAFTDVYEGENSLKVNYSSAITGSVVGGVNCKDIWFTSWNVELAENAQLTIVAKSSSNSYSRTLTVKAGGLSFKVGCLNTLNVDMASATVEALANYSGSYLILASNAAGNVHYALKGEASGTRIASVDYDGSTTSYDGSDPSLVWTIAQSGNYYTVKNEDNYIGWTSGNAADLIATANYDSDKCQMSISYDSVKGTYRIANAADQTRILARNTSNAYFAFYVGTQQLDLLFVPVDNRNEVTLSFDAHTISKTTLDYSEFTGQAVSADPNVSAITSNITYELTGDNIGSITSGYSVSLNGNTGTATVTASFAGDENYRAASASYTINVEDASTRTLTFPFSSNIDGWPTSSGSAAAGSYTYNLSGTDYTFTHTKEGNGIYCSSSSYLMIVSGNYLGLPAISGYKLTSVSAQLNGGGNPSTSAQGTITSNTSGTVVSGGATQTFDTKGQSKTFTLTGTAENTVYYLAISNKNFQCTELVLVYEIAAPDTRDEAGLAWKKSGVEVDSDTASLEDADNVLPTISLYNPNSLTVTYSSSNTSVATIIESGVGAGTISLVATGSTTISATFAGNDDYKPATVEYTLTVSDNRTNYAFTTIAGLNNLVTSTSSSFNGYLTDAVVSFVPQSNTAIVKDATGSVMFYKSNHGLKQGQTFTGAITVTAIKYNSLYSEVTAWGDVTFSGSETTVAPESVTLSALNGHYDDYQNAYVQVAGLSITSIDGSGNKNIHVTDGNNSYVIYDNPGTHTCAVGDVITVKGTVSKYSTTEQIKVWAAADITITAVAPKAITFTQPTGAAATAGCSIAVTVGGNAHSSGNTVASGTIVTLTATAGTDYEFTSWNVTGATVADASASTTTFTMGTSVVAVSASFTSTGGGNTPDSIVYTLTPTSGSNNSYASNCDIDINGITWNLTGNSQQDPWRIGGAKKDALDGVDRALYSKTALGYNISKIDITHGTTAYITVNSMTVIVSKNSDFSNPVSTLNPSFAANNTVTVNRPDGVDWTNCYYKIVYNISKSNTSNAGYLQFTQAAFTGK